MSHFFNSQVLLKRAQEPGPQILHIEPYFNLIRLLIPGSGTSCILIHKSTKNGWITSLLRCLPHILKWPGEQLANEQEQHF